MIEAEQLIPLDWFLDSDRSSESVNIAGVPAKRQDLPNQGQDPLFPLAFRPEIPFWLTQSQG
jgi:hypothetical protein